MLKRFLKERAAWLFFFLFAELMLLFIGCLDPSLPFSSMAYIALLLFIAFLVFLAVRHQRETAFFQDVDKWHPTTEIHSLKKAGAPFEKIVQEALEKQREHFIVTTEEKRQLLEEEKDDMLSWIHEIKTPLTAMKLMIEKIPDDKWKGDMMFEWLRIDHLLDQKLHQKRMTVIENDLYIEKLTLEPVIFEEIKNLRSWCIQKGIGFDVDLEVTEVLSDAKWLRFIIRQILTNAVKYTDNGEISIRSHRYDSLVHLEISDHGPGIEARDLKRIFEKGFTSTEEHDRAMATGMGLYLAKKAADALKMQILVSSVPGEGSTFTLRFAKENDLLRMTGV